MTNPTFRTHTEFPALYDYDVVVDGEVVGRVRRRKDGRRGSGAWRAYPIGAPRSYGTKVELWGSTRRKAAEALIAYVAKQA